MNQIVNLKKIVNKNRIQLINILKTNKLKLKK